MFCGWRLSNSYPQLEKLGAGVLTIDALSQACSFNGEPISSLPIAGELAAWLEEDLRNNGIPRESVHQAVLVAELSFGTVAKSARRTRDVHFGRRGQHLVPPVFVACDIRCHGRVVTDERVYESEHADYEEWPSGWPEG